MSGKVDYGETILEAASRELKEETGLSGDPTIVALKHYVFFDKKSNNLLEDKFMFLCLVENPAGDICGSQEGKYEWVKETNLQNYVTNPFEDYTAFNAQIDLIKNYNGTMNFSENRHYSEKF